MSGKDGNPFLERPVCPNKYGKYDIELPSTVGILYWCIECGNRVTLKSGSEQGIGAKEC